MRNSFPLLSNGSRCVVVVGRWRSNNTVLIKINVYRMHTVNFVLYVWEFHRKMYENYGIYEESTQLKRLFNVLLFFSLVFIDSFNFNELERGEHSRTKIETKDKINWNECRPKRSDVEVKINWRHSPTMATATTTTEKKNVIHIEYNGNSAGSMLFLPTAAWIALETTAYK